MQTISRRLPTLVFVAAALALLLRLAWVLAVANPMAGDAPWYDARAKDLLTLKGYRVEGVPTSFFPVGYPLFLATVYLPFGPSEMVAKLANVLLSTLLVLQTALLARKFFGERAAVYAAFIMAFYPSQIFYSSIMMPEILFTTCILGFMLLVARAPSDEPPSRLRLLAGGLLLGFAALIRPVAAVVLASMVLSWIIVRQERLRAVATKLGLILAVATLVVLPWTLRNIIVMKSFTVISNNDGVNFWLARTGRTFGEIPMAFGANWLRPAASPDEEIRAAHLAYAAGWDTLRQYPLEPLVSAPGKLLRFFSEDVYGIPWNAGVPKPNVTIAEALVASRALPMPAPPQLKSALVFFAQIYYLCVTAMAAIGAVWAWRSRRRELIDLLVVILGWMLFYAIVVFPLSRYRFPVMPLTVVFAASAMASLINLLPGGPIHSRTKPAPAKVGRKEEVGQRLP